MKKIIKTIQLPIDQIGSELKCFSFSTGFSGLFTDSESHENIK